VRRAALRAATSLLLDEGIAAVTFERVARLGGVSKTTLYKWWPSAAAIAVEGYFAVSAPQLELADSGDIAADLRAQLGEFVELMTRSTAGPAVRGLIASAQADDDVRRAFVQYYVRPRREIGGAGLRRAQARGQLSTRIDVQVLIDQIWGACYYRLLTEPELVTATYLDALVDQALRGAAAR
jgi:AcrR family transcriptional regulator